MGKVAKMRVGGGKTYLGVLLETEKKKEILEDIPREEMEEDKKQNRLWKEDRNPTVKMEPKCLWENAKTPKRFYQGSKMWILRGRRETYKSTNKKTPQCITFHRVSLSRRLCHTPFGKSTRPTVIRAGMASANSIRMRCASTSRTRERWAISGWYCIHGAWGC